MGRQQFVNVCPCMLVLHFLTIDASSKFNRQLRLDVCTFTGRFHARYSPRQQWLVHCLFGVLLTPNPSSTSYGQVYASNDAKATRLSHSPHLRDVVLSPRRLLRCGAGVCWPCTNKGKPLILRCQWSTFSSEFIPSYHGTETDLAAGPWADFEADSCPSFCSRAGQRDHDVYCTQHVHVCSPLHNRLIRMVATPC